MNIQESHLRLILTYKDNIYVHPNGNNANSEDQKLQLPPPPQRKVSKAMEEVQNTPKEEKERQTINCLTTSKNGLMAIATDNKQLLIYNLELKVIQNWETNRVASKIIFTPSENVIVADRTGDVYLYEPSLGDQNAQKPPVLLLGHLSPILDMTMTRCGKYLITCDRDEKIRVSSFPNTYNIISFCLGHLEFVISINVERNVLISASGDGTIRFWDYIKGKQLNCVNSNDFLGDSREILLKKFAESEEIQRGTSGTGSVEISALPVLMVSTFSTGTSNFFYVAALVHLYSGVQLYKSDFDDVKSTALMQTISFDVAPLLIYGSGCFFYVLVDSVTLKLFNLLGGENCEIRFKESDNCTKLAAFVKKYSGDFAGFNSGSNGRTIDVLYKRKFDNVQEYLCRKKLRMETLMEKRV